MNFLEFFEVWIGHGFGEIALHILPHIFGSDNLSKACAWSPRSSLLGLPVQTVHRKMTSLVLRIPVQRNVTLLKITVHVWGFFGTCTVD